MRWLLDTHADKSDAGRVFAQARAVQGTWIGFSAMTKLEALGYS